MKYLYIGIVSVFVVGLLGLFTLTLPEFVHKAREGQHRTELSYCQALTVDTASQILGEFPHPLPPALLTDAEQNPAFLESFAGKVILLHFWSPSCENCMEELQALHQLASHLHDIPFVVILVRDDAAMKDTVPLPIFGPSVFVRFDKNGQTANRYGVKQLPQTFLIDRSLRIQYLMVGPRTNWASEEPERCIRALAAPN